MDRHDLELRDIRDGELVVSYNAIHRGETLTNIRVVSSRLPVECLTLFHDGTVDVDELTPEEREWVRVESSPNEIDFKGVKT